MYHDLIRVALRIGWGPRVFKIYLEARMWCIVAQCQVLGISTYHSGLTVAGTRHYQAVQVIA